MRGRVVYLFAFDVAQEIRTAEVRTVLSEKPFSPELQLGPAAPKDIRFYQPLTVVLPVETRPSNVGPVTLKTSVKVFDVGVLSISFEAAFELPRIPALGPYHQLAIDGVPLDRRAEELCVRAAGNLRPYMTKPTETPRRPEAYTTFCLDRIDDDPDRPVTEWVQARRGELAQLLGEEPGPPLAVSQVNEMFRVAQSYSVADYTVIDWDAALVIDRSGYFDDVLYVIELANLQLEEFRLLDDRLDEFFSRAYTDLDRYFARPRIFRGPRKIMNSLRTIRMDVTRMTEEVSNITKFVGDWYLARLYLGCRDRFHLATWQRSIDQKLEQLDKLYSIANTEINNWRMILLEALIVALFLLDLATIFFLKPG